MAVRDWKKTVIAFMLAVVMLVSPIATTTAHATAATLTAGYLATSVTAAEVEAAVALVTTAGASVLVPVTLILGGALLVGAAGYAIYTNYDTIESTAQTIGNNIISTIDEQSDAMKCLFVSVVNNIASDVDYYTTHTVTYTRELLTSLQATIFGYVGAEAIASNVGLVSQNIIPASYLARMTSAQLETYNSYKGVVYAKYTGTGTAYPMYGIYEVPASASVVWYDTANNLLRFVDSANSIISTTFYGLRYASLALDNMGIQTWSAYQYAADHFTMAITGYDESTGIFTGDDYTLSFGGLISVVAGATLADALGLTVDFPWVYDDSAATTTALYPTDALDIPLDDVIGIAAGDIAITDVAEDVATYDPTTTDTTDTTTGLTGILDSFLDKLIAALKTLLEWLFVPSEGFLDGWIDGMMATVEDRTGILTYPLSLTISFLGKVVNISDADATLTIPEVTWQGSVLIKKQTFNFDTFLADNTAIATYYSYYMIVARAILIFAVLRLAWKKGEEMTEG